MVTWTRVIAVEVAEMRFADGLVACGAVACEYVGSGVKDVSNIFGLSNWKKRGCYYLHGEDDARS